ncbi:MAG: pentapeptide repeat-containing protein [Nitrosotalea sp.]
MRTILYKSEETRWFLPFLFVSGVILFLLRKPLVVLVQPGRVEDVDILLQQAIQHSWSSLFIVYNYYFHFIPRLVTLVSLYLFGITNVNLAMNLAAIIIATLCAVFFATKQFRFIIKSDLLRAVCSLFIILVSGVNEIYSNISSIQWFLNIFTMLFTALLLFRYDEYEKKSKKKKYLYAFFCSMSFLSSAFSIIFLPALIYVIIRELKNKKEIITVSSYVIPTVLLLFQALILYVTYSQQFKSPALSISGDVLRSSVNVFTISTAKIFYYDTPVIFQHSGELMYLIPIAMITFFLLNSIRNGLKLEIYIISCMFATLFWTSIIRHDLLDWQCLCGTAEERYFFFTVVFAFILLTRQFDKRSSLPFKLIFVSMMIIIIPNIVSGFFIPSSADENWKYVTKLYDSSGSYQCYVGEVPHGWALSIPCSKPISNNVTMTASSSSTVSGPSITFTPPVVSTSTSITSSSSNMVYGSQVTFTATVLPTPDSGAVQLYIDGAAAGNPVTIFGGQTVFSTSLPVGSHQIFASYSGAPNFFASHSGLTIITVLSMSNLKGANLLDANLQGLNMSGINLSGANLEGANLQGTNLSGSNLEGANLSGASLQGANLKGANLQASNMQNANLQNANLADSNLQNVNLSGVILSNADLSGTNLSDADLKGANLSGANFGGAITNGCNGCP